MTTFRAACVAAVTLTTAVAALAQAPAKTRQDILRYAATGMGSPYVWGGGNWDPNNRAFGGADCSGFVSKCWSISRWTPYRVDMHGPSTAGYIQTPGSDWYEISRSDLRYGDAIVYRYDNNQSGHTYIYLAGDGWGEHEVYEARGTAYGIVHRWRTTLSAADVVKAIRSTHVIENIGVTEHIVETDDGAPAYVDSGMTGSSQYDSYALGCTEGSCRYRWVTATRNETCTYRPNLPEAGWYRVYVTCNEGSPNVHDVGVTVHSALGSARYLWDQTNAALLNQWQQIGDGSFYFEAGNAGTVVWDDYNAWPITGDNVFRGDATRFVLDNRVVVDGVGGAPGTFATLNAATAWLRTHASEAPDIIDITCNTLLEPACVQLNMWDDVTINGDADGDGVAVTIVVTPSAPADWSTRCGLYLDIPIQHTYTLRDLTLVPAYVSAGHAVAAHGLVIDEQNPSGHAAGFGLTLDHVTIAGSLPGNILTDPHNDQRALATMFGGVGGANDGAVLQRTSTWAGDDICRQTVNASGLTVTHSAAAGLVLTSAYTAWEVNGGLRLTYNGATGLLAYHLGGSTLRVKGGNGALNQIAHNVGRGVTNLGDGGSGAVRIDNCALTHNGGGVYTQSGATELHSCVIAENVVSGLGGAVWQAGGSTALACCTVANNTAEGGGGAVYNSSGTVALADSIVWDNGASALLGSIAANYCAIQGSYAGTGNIDHDPVFVDADAGNYHLRRRSPCINAGDPAGLTTAEDLDIDGEVRRQAMYVDMGADETDFWDGDADQDGDVDALDVAVLVGCMNGPALTPAHSACATVFDVDEDGDIDLADLAELRGRSAGPRD